ncbi:MAG: pyrimidine 5'-nucleotidase [Pseudomonadota bacterium]
MTFTVASAAAPALAVPSDAVDPRPAFARVATWVFDLDNTLYPPHERLFDQIEALISGYVMRELGVTEAEAARLRRAYWHDHGTTLAGLMIHHGIDPDPFLHEVHEIDFAPLTPNPALAAAIAALPGRKIVYTNGTADYARRTTAALGLQGLFEAFYGVESAFYTPKPEAAAYQRIFGADGLDPRRAAMFEDDPRNLRVPAQLGLETVWVVPQTDPRPTPAHAGWRTADLTGFLSRLV